MNKHIFVCHIQVVVLSSSQYQISLRHASAVLSSKLLSFGLSDFGKLPESSLLKVVEFLTGDNVKGKKSKPEIVNRILSGQISVL